MYKSGFRQPCRAGNIHRQAVMRQLGCRENLAGAGEKRRRFRCVVTRADVGEIEQFRPGITREARRFIGAAVTVFDR